MDSTKYVGLDVHKDFDEEIIQMRNQFGGFDFQKVEESTDVRFVALARADGQPLRINPEVDAAERTASRRFCSLRRAWARLRGN